jgi:hypothetical protein
MGPAPHLTISAGGLHGDMRCFKIIKVDVARMLVQHGPDTMMEDKDRYDLYLLMYECIYNFDDLELQLFGYTYPYFCSYRRSLLHLFEINNVSLLVKITENTT